MKMEVTSKGIYSLTQEEEDLLKIINGFEFRLNRAEKIRFQDIIDTYHIKLVLDGSEQRTKLIDSSRWKLNDFAHNIENVDNQENPREDGDGLEPIQKNDNRIIEQLSQKREQLESEKANGNNGNNIVLDMVKKLLEKLKSKPPFYVGCYLDFYLLKGSFTPADNSVTLFMNNLSNDNRASDVLFVYIHEMFHAYFKLCSGSSIQQVREIEECMAEFGALAFLEKLKEKFKDVNDKFEKAFEYAKLEVEKKRCLIGDLAADGFGKYVFDHCSSKPDWIVAYVEQSRKLDANMPDVKLFIDCVYPFYPFMEQECLKLLARILFQHEEHQERFNHFGAFHSVAMRILVIDDKVGCQDGSLECGKKKNNKKSGVIAQAESKVSDSSLKTEQKVVMDMEVEPCDPNIDCSKKKCKLCTIKRLMDDGAMSDGKIKIFDGIGLNKDYFYWKEEGIECFYCPSICGDFIDGETPVPDFNNKDFYKVSDFVKNSRNNLNVQIVGVHDVRTALILLRRYKFDMIFCDYLLDKKNDGSNEREYANQLFAFLTHEYKNDIVIEEKKFTKDEKKLKKLKALDQLRHDVLDNRGPLDKLWIMPITGFNQTFIQDLYRNQINLIGHKWNISNGADPITTPWQFLYHLNKFIELQLKFCVYKRDKLMTFLQYSGDDLINRIKRKKDGLCFEEFQQFMGAEYANFMKRYGARKLIERDAALGGDNTSKSVFATYIAKKFYNDPKYSIETELNRKMQSFYHWAATMFNDRYGHKRLRLAFEEMRVFIAYNKLEEEAEDSHRLLYDLRFLHAVIDSEFDCKKISDWLEYNRE